MAKLDQIELPNGVTYDFDDKYARKLTNNDFDTINVTELNAGDLIVTGVGRFTNGLYGNLIGNASTATLATTASKLSNTSKIGDTNKPVYFTASGVPSAVSYTLGAACEKGVDTTVTSGSSNLVTSGAVYTAIDNLPEPMVFKGTLGTGGTITSLPTAAAANEGFTYKVITAGTYASQTAKVGDVFVSNGSSWVLIPSGDTDSDTWRSIKVNGTEKLTSAISSGAVDFVNGTNTTVNFNTTGSKISINSVNTTYSLSASGESVVLSGSDNTSTTADLSAAFANYMPKAGGAFTGRVVYNNVSMPLAAGKVTGLTAGTTEIFKNAIAFSNPATPNDLGWIRVLGTGESDTVLEIATGDDGGGSTAEKIVARQYNTSNAIAKEAVLLAPDGTTSFPVSVTAPKFIGNLQGTADYAASMAEANLTWGGKNFSGAYGCLDAALMDELGANRFQFIKANAITVEYSRDAGVTWTDYEATDLQKQQIFAQGGGLVIGKADSTHKATEHPGEYQLRITIDTGVANIYTYLNKFVVYVSTNQSSGCLCKIQKALQSTPTTFVDHTDWITVTGWSGYNVLNTSYLVTYGNTASNQYGRVRFIFKDTESTGTSYNGLTVYQIKAFGGVGWYTPSTMAKTGHIYSYNENMDATFPAIVTSATLKSTGDIYEAGSKLSDKYSAKTGNANYVRVKNSSTVGQSSSFTFNDLAKQHFAMGMIYSGTDSPTGTNGWRHGISMAWEDGVNTSWVSQIAIGVSAGTGMWYRTNSGTIIGRTWNKLLDDSNYTTYTVKKDGTGASGTWGISISGNAATATSATTATKARLLGDETIRPASANTTTYNGALRYFLSTSSMTTAKPIADGSILSMEWDNNGGYAKQLYLDHSGGVKTIMQVRSQNGGTWGSWIPVGVFRQTTPTSGQVVITDGTDGGIKSSGYTIATSVPSEAVFTDTKNTAGSTDTSSKIFLIGATSQAANPQTYSDNEVYTTSGVLTTKSIQVGGGSATMEYSATTKSINFVFAS